MAAEFHVFAVHNLEASGCRFVVRDTLGVAAADKTDKSVGENYGTLFHYLYTLRNAMLAGAKPNLRILHPLPRVNEVDRDVDDNDKAYYFEQARNGVFARQAILTRALGIDPRSND